MTEQALLPKDEAIVFYCKDCKGLVNSKRVGTKYVYKCGECNSKRVAFGTMRSIKDIFLRK